MHLRRVVPLAAVALACASVSCAAVLGFERLTEGLEDGGADGAIDGPVADSGPDGPDPCRELGIPPAPTDAGTGNAPPILSALRVLDFGIEVDGGRPQIPGLNLDLVCSTDIASSSCTTKLLPTTFETHAKDKSATGLDNAGFSLIEYISRYSDVLSPQGINQGITDGLYGAVVRVDGWNGLDEDDRVSVEVFPAIGFGKNGEGGKEPHFDENDIWKLDDRFKVGGVLQASTIKSASAWVTGRRLVARFDKLTLMLLIDDDPKPFEIRIQDGILTAAIGADSAGKPSLREGMVSGRWKTSDFLGQVRTIYLEDSNGLVDTTLCDNVTGAQLIYQSVKDAICSARDIRSDSADNQNLPCDAVSAAARIDAYAITELGNFTTADDGGVRCENPAVPVDDDCSP